MPGATNVQSSFAGGQWSAFAQGRYHDPKYRTAMAVCRNGLPLETESWVRRPGTRWAGATRGGAPGAVIRFDFEDETPAYSLEFTDGNLRPRVALGPAETNDPASIVAISTANPAVMQLAAAVTWQTGDRGVIANAHNPLLDNRALTLTKIDTQHFSLADAITGAAIDGSTLGAIGAPTFVRFLDIATPYIGGTWASLDLVQSENTAFCLHGSFAPQALTVQSEPTVATFATFTFGAATFEDGPYLDPPKNGALLTPNQQTGIVQLTLSSAAYSATTSYAVGDIVTSSASNYVSLADQNINHTPASSPTFWKPTNGNVAVNDGKGFLQTDIGRLIRLFSEPAPWASGTSYGIGAIVSYNPSGQPNQVTYWSSLTASNSGNTPGKDTKNWQLLLQGGDNSPALWSWGKITSLVNFIIGNPAGIAQVGNMTANGGLAAAFNGNTSQNAASSAGIGATTTIQTSMSLTGFVGQNYSGTGTTAYAIQSATIFGSIDQDLVLFQAQFGQNQQVLFTATAYLLGSNSPPAAWNDGTQLGSVQLVNASEVFTPGGGAGFPNAPVNITSNDQSTQYSYIWIAIQATMQSTFSAWSSGAISFHPAQVEFVAAATSSSTTNGVSVELLGAALLYSTAISTWRLGRFSATTGWPTTGTWTDDRLWLSGVQPNVIDASCAEGVTTDSTGTVVNFAPTDQYGNVLASSGISIKLSLPEANPILWMVPDQQGVLCGTHAREVLVFPPTQGGFAPNNIDSRMLTRIGSAAMQPVRTEHTIVFVQKFVRKIVEFFADVFSGKFTAPNLIKDAKDLSAGGIAEIAYQQELAPIVWARVGGALIGCTYKRDTLMTSSGPTMQAWHNHDLGSGRTVESICAGTSINGNLDALTMVTNDAATGVRFVEVLGDIPDEGTPLSAAAYLDSAIVPTSTAAVAVSNSFPYGGLQLNGLWPLNGKTVTAWLGGLDCGDYVVTNGAIQVPYGDGIGGGLGAFPANATRGDQGLFTAAFVATGVTANGKIMFTGAMPMLVGFTFTSQGQLLRPFQPAESGTRNGPAFGKLSRSHYIMAQLEGAAGVSFGYGFGAGAAIPAARPAIFYGPDGRTPLTVDQQFTGIFRDNFDCPDTLQGVQVAWQITRPYICNVTAIGAALETRDV